MFNLPPVLVISGIDPTNGAGAGRDILTIRENGCHPLSVPSVLTVQNSMNFRKSEAVAFDYISESIELLQKEFQISSIKTGLLPLEREWISNLTKKIALFNVPTVIDTVFKATASNSKELIIPDSYLDFISGSNKVITPNLKELGQIYLKFKNSLNSAPEMAEQISKEFGCTVVTTFEGTEPFVAVTTGSKTTKISIELFDKTRKIHGTGCTFSSALAANLAKKREITKSIKAAADYTLKKIKKSAKYSETGQYFL
ncbi:MAG: bifunctional hydroxymethylpyrimidine kinase/phosphomethylpyrimidine kinase [bacterium]